MNATPEAATAAASIFRPKLLAIAYRMLGSSADAEDAVQDAYLRFHQATGVQSPEAWLVRTTTHLCIDRLRQAKRRETYVGPWLPEPVHSQWEGAVTDESSLAESLSMAFLVLLETLSPAERAAYLLREVFGYEFDEIATLLDKNSASIRQLVVRAKQRIHARKPRFQPTAAQVDEVADRFFTACRIGDIHAIESMLATDVVLYSDGGGKAHAAPKPVEGSQRIAKLLSVVFRKLQSIGELTLTTVNGQPGAVFSIGGQITEIFTFDTDAESIHSVYAILNPEKLCHWPAPSPGLN